MSKIEEALARVAQGESDCYDAEMLRAYIAQQTVRIVALQEREGELRAEVAVLTGRLCAWESSIKNAGGGPPRLDVL